MNLEYFSRIALYNANPITLLGQGIQCIYEGSFAWIATATHPLFAGDYYMEEDDYFDPLPESLPAPSLQTPFPEPKLATPLVVASISDVIPPLTLDPPPCVATTPFVAPAAPLYPAPPVVAVATQTLLTPDVAGPPEKLLSDLETEQPNKDDLAFLRYWRTPTTEDSSLVPDTVTEPPITLNIPTSPTPPLSVCPSEASTLPPYMPYEDEARVPHEELVNFVDLPSLPLDHSSWPEQSEQYLPPLDLKSPVVLSVDSEYRTSDPRKRRSRKSDLAHILNPEPHDQKRTKRHSSRKKTIEGPDEEHHGPSGEEPAVRFHSTAHPYHHQGRHRKSRRKDRIYDRVEAHAGFEALDKSPPPQMSARPPTPHPRHRELPPTEDHRHGHHQGLRRKNRIYDNAEADADLEAPSPERRDESPPPQRRLARPPTPHPRHKELPEHLYAEADEFLDHLEKQLWQVKNTLHDLKEEHYSSEGGNNILDVRKKDRKERRKEKEKRRAPYASRSSARSERRHSELERVKANKTRRRGTPQGVDDIGTLGLGTLSLLQPQATYTDPSGSHLLQPSAGPWGLDTLLVALPELNTSQQAGPSEGAMQLGSLAAALPVVQQPSDGELSILLQGVQLSVGPGSSEDQGQSEVPPSTTQTAEGNQHWSDVEGLGNTLTRVQLCNDTSEQEQTRPLTIRIPSMAQLQARIAARNATVAPTPLIE